MYGIVAGLVIVGTTCGTFIRMPLFIGILVVAVILAAASTVAEGASGRGINAVIAIATLQIGYAAGLVLRAARCSLIETGTNAPRGSGNPSVSLPSGPKHL
jgi:hypothetical protein